MREQPEIAEMTGALLGSALGCGFVIGIIGFMILIWWRIFTKAGYSGAMSLLMVVPLLNLVMLCILAFGEWPIEREVARLRQGGGAPGAPIL